MDLGRERTQRDLRNSKCTDRPFRIGSTEQRGDVFIYLPDCRNLSLLLQDTRLDDDGDDNGSGGNAHAYSYTDGDTNAYGNSDCDAYGNSNANFDPHADTRSIFIPSVTLSACDERGRGADRH